jgi:hypothetical protein
MIRRYPDRLSNSMPVPWLLRMRRKGQRVLPRARSAFDLGQWRMHLLR